MTQDFKYEDAAQKTLSVETRKALAARIKDDVDVWCMKEFTDEHRHHLGASVLGQDCERQIWYGWRWVKKELFSGRMLRLFNTGHLEEQRIIRWLRGIGCQVWDVDPNTGKQFRIYGVQGHYGGAMDSGGMLPYFPDLPMLFEFKTHNTKSFDRLVSKGVILSKPQHFDQMCQYGKHYGFKYALYCANCKDDDDLHFEVVELDWNRSNEMENRAHDIIYAKEPPPRIAENPSYYKCKMCVLSDVCFTNAPIDINCRSCKMAEPIDNGEWFCHRYQQNIPKDFMPKGCEGHTPII